MPNLASRVLGLNLGRLGDGWERALGPPHACRRDVRRSPPLPGHVLTGRKLDPAGAKQGLRPLQRQGHGQAGAEEGPAVVPAASGRAGAAGAGRRPSEMALQGGPGALCERGAAVAAGQGGRRARSARQAPSAGGGAGAASTSMVRERIARGGHTLWRNEHHEYDVSEEELAELLEPLRPNEPCPSCERRGRRDETLVLRESQNGALLSCTSYGGRNRLERFCGHKERACEKCRMGIMIRDGRGLSQCHDRRCGWTVPLCVCAVPKPMKVYRRHADGHSFLGCQDYGRDATGCRATQDLERRERPMQRRRRKKRKNRARSARESN